ncbi:MAG: uracil-DNA glycosylase, partial [Candidatus Binatia bacterium]
AQSLPALATEIVGCRRCPRLVEWRERVAKEPPRRFRGQVYWAKPLPGFGDPAARLFIVGLAPAANGGNRTGRIFTGDRSGDWLYGTLYAFGFSNQPTSVHRDDGLKLTDCYISAAVRCAPPDNRPTPQEFDRCRPYLVRELQLLKCVRVVVALGKIAFDSFLKTYQENGGTIPKPRPQFGHGSIAKLDPSTRPAPMAGGHSLGIPAGSRGCVLSERSESKDNSIILLGSYHPSQQNTFTGKLTQEMFHSVFAKARELIA